jgi:hypothetical protein
MVSATVEGRRVAARADVALGDYRRRLRALPPEELAALDVALEHLERAPARPPGSRRGDLGGGPHAGRAVGGTGAA